MDEIVDTIRQNLERVKEREAEVVRQEAALKAEVNSIKEKTDALDEARLEYEKKIAQLEKEKLAMSKGHITNEDLVQINVQGETFCTMRGTLTQFPETRLAYMFNGRWKDKLPKDSDGRIFLDVPPALFRKLLDYLTSRRMAGADDVPCPNVEPDQMQLFKLMLKFFEVESSIYSQVSCFSKYLKSPYIELTADGSTATNTSHGMGYVLGQDVYEKEVIKWLLKIEKLENPWMFFGVMRDEESGKESINDCSFNGNVNAFGWADKGGFWKAGKRQTRAECNIPLEVLHQGQVVEMVLNGHDAPSSLSIKLMPEGHVQRINDLPGGEKWRLHLNLVSCNDSVRLVKVERSPSDLA